MNNVPNHEVTMRFLYGYSRVQTQAVLPRVRSEEGSEEACSEERSEEGLSSARLNRGRVKLLRPKFDQNTPGFFQE